MWIGSYLLTGTVLLLGCGSSASPPSAATEFGFNEDPVPRGFALQADLAMPLRRFQVPWSNVEPAPGEWQWSYYDEIYEAMRRAGLQPVITAIGTPCWTRGLTPPCVPGVPPPTADTAWADYVHRLTSRYPEARGIEVWNEPNIAPLFPPYPDPTRYTALLQIAFRAVNDVDPEMPVVSGGLFHSANSGPFGIADGSFLASMYEAGAKGYMDAISIHPYPIYVAPDGTAGWDPGRLDQVLESVRSVRDAAGDEATPIWVTEMGVSTASAQGFPPAATETQQAEYLLEMVRSARAAGDVPVVLIHRLMDGEPDAFGDPLVAIESGFGVYRADGTPKPAACSLSDEFGGSLAC